LDYPDPLLPSSPFELGNEINDLASSELHFPCSRKDFHDRNSFLQFSQTRSSSDDSGFANSNVLDEDTPSHQPVPAAIAIAGGTSDVFSGGSSLGCFIWVFVVEIQF
jgi:hypothetical protein